MNHILVVDDDPNTLASVARAFRMAGYEATVCESAARALQLMAATRYDVVLSDVVMPGMDGITMLEQLRAAGVSTPVIMISGQANVEMAVRATRLGAIDFLEKPLSTDKLLLTVANVLRLAALEEENRQLRIHVGKHEIVWACASMRELMTQVERVAASETRVCILGETGTGKELVARTLHAKSPRRDRPFVTLNCAAVPAELMESELFGHEKGAFTGAGSRHTGKFEQAHRGTLFLDEIGDMPAAMQAKLLRVLEEGEIERVGGDQPVNIDVRVIVATHRDLEDLAARGAFRSDLFHRVYVFPIRVPALRDRKEDIPVLVGHFAARVAEQNGWQARTFSAKAIESLASYDWPGNVRELRNVVERLLLADGEVNEQAVARALPQASGGHGPALAGSLAERIEAMERGILIEELRRHGYRMAETARSLGLERSHLYKKCQHHRIPLKER